MEHWTALTPDPTDPLALEQRRRRVLRAAAGRLMADRIEYLCSLAAGRRVLDVGVVDHTLRDPHDPQWLHGRLRQVAARCVGVDVLDSAAARLRDWGFDVRCWDLTQGPLEERFDLIVLGEVLEHLGAPLALLRSARLMLEPGGVVVVTTPNPWYAGTVLRSITRSSVYADNADHTAWYDPCTLCELGYRAGLELYRHAGVKVRYARKRLTRLFLASAPLWMAIGIKPEFFAKTIIYEFRPASAALMFPP